MNTTVKSVTYAAAVRVADVIGYDELDQLLALQGCPTVFPARGVPALHPIAPVVARSSYVIVEHNTRRAQVQGFTTCDFDLCVMDFYLLGRIVRVDEAAAQAAVKAAQVEAAQQLTSDEDFAVVLNARGDLDSQWKAVDEADIDGYGIAVSFESPVADPAALLGYWFKTLGCGHDGFDASIPGRALDQDADGKARTWVFGCDMSKARRTDTEDVLCDLPCFLQEGSPPRKTARTGPIGTRAVQGVGPMKILVAVLG